MLSLNELLSELVDARHIVAVDVTPVPAPPSSRYPGLHLMVNCHYDVGMAEKSPADLLEFAREGALDAIRRLAAGSITKQYASLVVTIYGHFPCPGAARPARRRIYRVNILTEDLLASSSAVSPSSLAALHADESSELEAIAELLHEAVH